MSAMEPTTVGYPPASEAERTGATQTGKIQKPYGDRYHKPVITPDLVGPDFLIPASVSKLFRKLLRRKDASAAQ
ncbi:MAG: hypothetical protein ACRDK7_09960 [Solirubrobacteraceae bacterium]